MGNFQKKLDLLPERNVDLGSHDMDFYQENQCIYMSAKEKLEDFPEKLTDKLILNAQKYPERTFAAQKVNNVWVHYSYFEVLASAWKIAEFLISHDLSEKRPILILSPNDIDHLLLSMGAMLAGVPFSAISPAFSLMGENYAKLEHVIKILNPGLVYAKNDSYCDAILKCFTNDITVVLSEGNIDRSFYSFDELLKTIPQKIYKHYETFGAERIAKFVFTSGSTKLPKAVPTTQKMLCANQQMLVQVFPEFKKNPPVLLDWLFWHHTFGGSQNVGVALYNAGSIYIDEGKPTDDKFDITIQNLKEISPTIYFNVPKGWAKLCAALEHDEQLRNSFFKDVRVLFFGGASLSPEIWQKLDEISLNHCGERIRIMNGLGMTETAPACTFSLGPNQLTGFIGFPAPGCHVKIAPTNGKMEFRVKGPNVMQGYWGMSKQELKDVFDEEGYYRTGDAVTFVNANDPSHGLFYDGRLAEDFKLDTGVFVNVGNLRNKALIEGKEIIQDVCLVGSNRSSIGILIFPKVAVLKELLGSDADNLSNEEILSHSTIQNKFKDFLIEFNQQAVGSSTRIASIYLMEEPLNPQVGEVTDKGTLNQANIVKYRSHLIDELYTENIKNKLIIKA